MKSVYETKAEFKIDFEDGSSTKLCLANPSSSVAVGDKSNALEYRVNLAPLLRLKIRRSHLACSSQTRHQPSSRSSGANLRQGRTIVPTQRRTRARACHSTCLQYRRWPGRQMHPDSRQARECSRPYGQRYPNLQEQTQRRGKATYEQTAVREMRISANCWLALVKRMSDQNHETTWQRGDDFQPGSPHDFALGRSKVK